jgi:hypothetical protein
MLFDTATIQRRAKDLAASLGKPDFRLRSEPMHDGSSHLEVGDAYYLIVTERGEDLSRRRTRDVDELLYWVMAGLTWKMASDHELAHRRKGEDTRRQLFAKQVELLATISPEWAERQRREQAAILERYPFENPVSGSGFQACRTDRAKG